MISAEQLCEQNGIARRNYFDAKKLAEELDKYPKFRAEVEDKIFNGEAGYQGCMAELGRLLNGGADDSEFTKGIKTRDEHVRLLGEALEKVTYQLANGWRKAKTATQKTALVSKFVGAAKKWDRELLSDIHTEIGRALRLEQAEARS